MSNTICVTGVVATHPRHIVTEDNLAITAFRLAAQSQTRNETTWFTVTSYGPLAINAAGVVSKGDRVIVMGEVTIHDEEVNNTTMGIAAQTLGHDLNFGASVRTTVQMQGGAL